MARSPLFRELLATIPGPPVPAELAGLATGADERHVRRIGSDERAARQGGPGADLAADGVTPELWPDPPAATPDAAQRTKAPAATGSHVGDLTGGLAPTPELLAAVAALPAATETPRLRGEDPTAPDPGFRLARLLRPVRGLLALTILLVGLDALTTLAFPTVARYAVDSGITAGDPGALRTAVLIGLGIVALSWVVAAAETLVTARGGESLLYLLRVRSYAHLQRLGLDYYERELSGRIMTRMTTDVDALSTFLQTGLAQAVVSLLTVVGVAVALLVTDVNLALVALAVLPVLIGSTLWFRVLSARAYAEARERVAVVNADMQENVTGVRVAQAFTREQHSAAEFSDRSLAYRRSRLRAQRYIATFFPFVALLSDLATAAVLGVGASRVAAGGLTPGVLTAFLLYLGLFFAPVQQLSQVFDGYQQARDRAAPHRRAAAHADDGAGRGHARGSGPAARRGRARATSASPTRGRTGRR